MARLLTIFLFTLSFSCIDHSENKIVKIPKSYTIQLDWGTYWDNQHIDHFVYSSDKDSAVIFTGDYKDSIYKRSIFKLDKNIADSIYIYALKNTQSFDLDDSLCCQLTDANNLSITLSSNNNLKVKNSYHSLPGYSVNNNVERIIYLIEKAKQDTTLF